MKKLIVITVGVYLAIGVAVAFGLAKGMPSEYAPKWLMVPFWPLFLINS